MTTATAPEHAGAAREATRPRIAVTGASGFIGSALVPALERAGYVVQRLVRRTARPGEIEWHPGSGRIDASALEGLEAVVHLAGENIAGGRWTRARRRRIIESRRQGTGLLARTLAGLGRPPAVLVSASAIGAYGDRGDTLLDERAARGTGFLAEVTEAWERAADPARAAGIRVVHPRFGIVLSPAGGALARMLLPFRFGLGAPLGSGRQWMSPVSIDDTVGAVLHAIRTPAVTGAMNVALPAPVTNREFTRSLARALHRPWLPIGVPAIALHLALGDLAEETLLWSARVVPSLLEATDYRFQHPTLDAALAHVLAARQR